MGHAVIPLKLAISEAVLLYYTTTKSEVSSTSSSTFLSSPCNAALPPPALPLLLPPPPPYTQTNILSHHSALVPWLAATARVALGVRQLTNSPLLLPTVKCVTTTHCTAYLQFCCWSSYEYKHYCHQLAIKKSTTKKELPLENHPFDKPTKKNTNHTLTQKKHTPRPSFSRIRFKNSDESSDRNSR